MIHPGFLGYPDLPSWLQAWLPIIFMGLLVVAVFLLLRTMPRTRPQQIKPDSAPSIGWSEIAGADEAKEELREVVDYLRDPKRFRNLGAKVPKGILLHGPPGTGKTLLAKAVAHESGATFFSQSAASFVEMFVGVGAARIRRLFKAARKHAPAIVFIDELDAVGGHRGSDISGERDQTLNQLLVELDGFSARKDVVVIAASNLLEKLDGALLRPGRFDRQLFVSPPDEAGRALCGELLPSVDRVHRISIVPRGSALGYTLNLPEEDRYLKTREELIDFMTMLLGGRASEELVFGSITTGAADDLKRVGQI